jgi:two-component system KDP operon response regulator KdpE
MTARILVVDDEPQIRRFLRISLVANGYQVIEAERAAEALAAARETMPDLVILDLGLPDLDGQEVITALRQTMDVPIIVLSVRADEMDKVEALDRGANDYVVKPFGVAELMARIRASLRPSSDKDAPDVVEIGPVVIDLKRRVVTRAGEEVRLSRREWDILAVLARRPDHVLTHRTILREVWGPAHIDETAYLRVYVRQLRQKLESDPACPRLIVTDPGVGYRLKRE